MSESHVNSPSGPVSSSLEAEVQSSLPEKKIGLNDILTGWVEPSKLCESMRNASGQPWLWPIVLSILSSLIVTICWVKHVDLEAFIRTAVEKSAMSAAQMDQAVEMQKRLLIPISVTGSFIGPFIGAGFMGVLFWLIGKVASEKEKPGFLQSFTAATFVQLAHVPYNICIGAMCLFKTVGGLSPEKLSPTGLGYYWMVDHPKLQALLYQMDLFFIASWVMAFIAAKHLMRLKPVGAALCVMVPIFGSAFQILFSR